MSSNAILWGMPPWGTHFDDRIKITQGTIPYVWREKRLRTATGFWKALWVDDHWTFYGLRVQRCAPNNMGMRWEVFIDGFKRAETKDGMRDVIRHHMRKGQR